MGVFDRIPLLVLLFFVSIAAYIIVFLFKNKLSKDKYMNLCQRIKTWMIIISIFYLASINKILMVSLFFIISYLSVLEFLNLFDFKITKELKIICLVISIVHYFSIYKNLIYIFYIFVPITLGIIWVLLKRKKEISISIFISIYLISFISYLVNTKMGIDGILVYIILIELNDVYQYITGNIFGEIKIVPKISPNKTLGGVIGGIILTEITLIFFNAIYGYGINLWMGIIISILGFLGDIFISYFKRKNHKKDTGDILSGHGGILDRVDSLVFTSPVILLVTLYL